MIYCVSCDKYVDDSCLIYCEVCDYERENAMDMVSFRKVQSSDNYYIVIVNGVEVSLPLSAEEADNLEKILNIAEAILDDDNASPAEKRAADTARKAVFPVYNNLYQIGKKLK